jgi:hypothetical protein
MKHHLIRNIKTEIQSKTREFKIVILTIFVFIAGLVILILFLIFSGGKNPCRNIPEINNTIINYGLVLYFPFNKNNSENIVCDLSGNKNYGIVNNATWNPAAGIFNDSVYEFNGINSEIKIRNSKDLSPKNHDNQFSVLFYARFDNTSFIGEGLRKNYVNYLGKATPENYEWEFRQYNSSNQQDRSNRLSFYVFNPEGGIGVGGYVQENITEGEWIFIAGVLEGDKIKIYKNGELKNTQYFSDDEIRTRHTKSDLYIGTADKGAYFKGAIDELRIYDRALSSSEIKMVYELNRSSENEIFKRI